MYKQIINNIKITQKEQDKIDNLIIKIHNTIPEQEFMVCGSVAKKTALKGASDIDIFLLFPLDTSMEKLKKNGLWMGHYITKELGGKSTEKYASHPYVTAEIDGLIVDFVPCYKIKDATELKSAVDRTPLHTDYVYSHLKNPEEVLLLKQFMKCCGVYGANAQVNGFSGYLCEILIMYYGSFENVLKASKKWEENLLIDLENHGQLTHFNCTIQSLVVPDPIDPYRNVAAALSTQKMYEFCLAARNYLGSNNKKAYFEYTNKMLPNPTKFTQMEDAMILLRFPLPKIPEDAIHSQIQSTIHAIQRFTNANGYKMLASSYECVNQICSLSFVFDTIKQNKTIKHYGPYLWCEGSDNFIYKYGSNNVNVDKKGHLYIWKQNPFPTIYDLFEKLISSNEKYKNELSNNKIVDSIIDYGSMIRPTMLSNSIDGLIWPNSQLYREHLYSPVEK